MYDDLVKDLLEKAEFLTMAEPLGIKNAFAETMKQAADAIEELIAKLNHADDQIERLVEAAEERRWIPVTEALPEMNQIVVVVQNDRTWDYGQFRGLAYLGGNIHKWNWKNNITKTVDYWMPKKSALPEPPKEEHE